MISRYEMYYSGTLYSSKKVHNWIQIPGVRYINRTDFPILSGRCILPETPVHSLRLIPWVENPWYQTRSHTRTYDLIWLKPAIVSRLSIQWTGYQGGSMIADKIMILLWTKDDLRMLSHRKARKQVFSADSPFSEQSSGQMLTEGIHQESQRI